MSLPTALRQVIEQRYREAHSTTDMRLLLLDRALKEVGNLPLEETQAAWLARAEQLDLEVHSPRTRLMHVRWLAAGWRLEEAEAALGTIPLGSERIAARNALAGSFRSRGNLAAAVSQYEHGLRESIGVLDASHVDTLAIRGNFALAVMEAGNPQNAAGLFGLLLEDLVRILGPDHPHTLTTRNNLARAVKEAGDPTRAANMLETLQEETIEP